MKRFLTLLALVACLSATVCAQQADFRKAVEKYKSASSMTATVERTKHNAALSNNAVSRGTLTMKRPNYVCIDVQPSDKKYAVNDQLIMNGSQFTMVTNGKKHVTSSQSNVQFRTFQAVMEGVLSGGATDLSAYSDLTIEKQGATIVLTIVPTATGKKEQRRMLFTSFVLVIDAKSSALKSLRFNERKGNFTEYVFSDFQFK